MNLNVKMQLLKIAFHVQFFHNAYNVKIIIIYRKIGRTV